MNNADNSSDLAFATASRQVSELLSKMTAQIERARRLRTDFHPMATLTEAEDAMAVLDQVAAAALQMKVITKWQFSTITGKTI